MKLNGIRILNTGSLRQHFNLPEVWAQTDNGVLRECEEELAARGEGTAEGALAGKIAGLLKAYETEEGLTAGLSGVYRDGTWDFSALKEALWPFLAKSRDHAGTDFYSRNGAGIRKLTGAGAPAWNEKAAALCYGFLLLMLQVRPRGVITEEEIALAASKLRALTGETEIWRAEGADEGSPSVHDQRHRSAGCGEGATEGVVAEAFGHPDGSAQVRGPGSVVAEGAAAGGARLYPCESGVLYLKEGRIINSRNRLLSPENEQIACYAYTKELGLIAFTREGELSACVEPGVRYEILRGLSGFQGDAGRIVMAAACGKIFILLTDRGTVFSNVQEELTGWKDIRWVGAGLNSITAVRGVGRSLLELGSDGRLTEYSGVRAAATRSADRHRYAVLKEDGTLLMDDGAMAGSVSAANLCREGYVYASGSTLFFRAYGSDTVQKYTVPEKGMAVEVCRYRSDIYYRMAGGGREWTGAAAAGMFS